MPTKLPLTRPLIDDAEERAVLEVLRSGWLVQGPVVAEFERTVAGYVGAQHGVATSSCTTALHLALLLLGVGPGDEVIVPSFTFIATANAVRYVGATPVFADVDPATHTLDAISVASVITTRTKCIVPVHQLGIAADMAPLAELARAHGIALLEDAAPALGAEYRGRRVGGLGHTSCLSFHPRKVITTGEGGMILTDDADLARRARELRAHGMSVSDLARHTATRVIIEEYPAVGYNYRMSDLHAAVGVQQMKKLDEVLASRRAAAARYRAGLEDLEWLTLPPSPPERPHTYQSYMVRLRPGAPKTRDQVMQELLEAGIPSRRGVMAIHLELSYRGQFPSAPLPVTEQAARDSLLLPIYAHMTEAEQGLVIDNLRRILSAA
jgi:dTDP-4-amino-4,6-dideoxygalactose transaminase